MALCVEVLDAAGALHVSVCAPRKQWAAAVCTQASVVEVVELPASDPWWLPYGVIYFDS